MTEPIYPDSVRNSSYFGYAMSLKVSGIRLPFVFVLSLGLLHTAFGQAQTIDPRGLFTRISQDDESQRAWVHIVPIPDQGTHRYYLTDLYGEGVEAIISPSGMISIEGAESGAFTTDDRAQLTLNGAGFDLIRAPLTDADYSLTLDQALPVSPLLIGDWGIREDALDVQTGEPMGATFVDVFSQTIHGQAGEGEGLRHTDSADIYYQLTMHRGDRGLIRYYTRNNGMGVISDLFDRYPGSSNNFARDLVGDIYFPDINHFEVRLALQGRLNMPNRPHFFLWIEGTRRDPLPVGDLNGDHVVNSEDRDLFEPLFGLDHRAAAYNLAADLDHNQLIDARDLRFYDGEEVGSYSVGPEISGSWFDPSHNGEGWNLIVIDDERVLVTWFSYRADAPEQAWFIGVGEIVGNEIILPQLVIPGGGIFGPDFDPATVVSPPWGGARFWFDTCNSGGMSWNAEGDFYNGALALARLSTLADLPCPSQPEIKGLSANAFAGHWYDPTHNGEGWLIEVLSESSALVYWFTFDDQGNQVWLVGTGTIDGNQLAVEQLTITRGTSFGSAFDPDTIELSDWGGLTFTLDEEGNAAVAYQSLLPQFGAGNLNAVRLVRYAGLAAP